VLLRLALSAFQCLQKFARQEDALLASVVAAAAFHQRTKIASTYPFLIIADSITLSGTCLEAEQVL
jgi:hypothetical protein